MLGQFGRETSRQRAADTLKDSPERLTAAQSCIYAELTQTHWQFTPFREKASGHSVVWNSSDGQPRIAERLIQGRQEHM
jgi:hypothetical protein